MRNKEYYMSLKYPILIKEFEDDGEQVFSAEIKELPGLIVYGDSVEEVYEELELAKSDWIDANLEWKREIPEPVAEDLDVYSGRLTLRMTKGLHKTIKEKSLSEGVSLNQMVVQLINDGLNNANNASLANLSGEIESMREQLNGISIKSDLLDNAYTFGKISGQRELTITNSYSEMVNSYGLEEKFSNKKNDNKSFKHLKVFEG